MNHLLPYLEEGGICERKDKEKFMGGSNGDTISGLRFHVSGGEVHVHDDSKSIKFTARPNDFKEQVSDALELLDDEDGMVKIEGKTKESLCIIKDGGTLDVCILSKRGIKQKLEKCIKAC